MTRALLLDEQLRLSLGERQLAPPRPGEALVRVEHAGVCGSDLHVLSSGAWVSYWPATLGHEVVGLVSSCPGGELAAGTRVVVDSRVPCGSCAGCSRAANLCERLAWVGEAFPGGFAEELVIAASSLVPCPQQLEPAIAVLAEPLAVAMHAVSRATRSPQRVLLLGYGPIGALVHAEIEHRFPQAAVHVREPLGSRRQLAAAFGADTSEPPAAPDLVVDAAGYPGSLVDALALTARGGELLVVALGHEAVSVVPADLVEQAVTVSGCSGFDDELPAAVARLAADPERYRPLVTEAVLLEEAVERLSAIGGQPAAGKLVIAP